MRMREFDFQTGIQTSSPPITASPTQPGDVVTLDFAGLNYTSLFQVKGIAASNAVIKAIAAAARANNQIVYHVGASAFYKFDSASVSADDADTVLQPDVGTGRWLKQTVFGSSGGFSAEWQLGNAVIPYYEQFDDGRLVSVSGSKSNVTLSVDNSGTAGSTTVRLDVYDNTGALTDTATASLAASGGDPQSSLAALSATLSYNTGDFIYCSTTTISRGTPAGLRVKL